ncbi:hypothetical protein MMOR_32000 [Mycolicibacterium moriokaense]|uniref:Uncharacterized protein n=1 Tax=Mycolicibacterium moriokaense TaxID=39691 RepID=A0AAD1HC09_9MYCO|nr:hypothetical protein MMOR_32000 [Mycolicibacterium moriokaense]
MSGQRTTFDKFGWLRALRTDHRLTDRDVRLAMAICTDWVRRDGTGWAVKLDVMADAVPNGMSRNRLKDALGRLTGLGYLVETGRTVGGRGVTAQRSHNLALPAPVAVQVNGETCTADGAGIDETRTATGSNPHRYGFKPAPLAVSKTSPDLDENRPLGTSTGTSVGTEPFSQQLFDENGVPNGKRVFKCPDCRDEGWVLDEDGAPLEPAIRCRHRRRSAS